jgi:hypothetical protein
MTDHTAIIERMAEEMWQAESVRAANRRRLIRWDEEGKDVRDKWRSLAQAALSASGLLEVLDASLSGLATIVAMRSVIEKSQQSNTKPSLAFGSDAMWRVAMADYDASETALRNAIKGVRDGAAT